MANKDTRLGKVKLASLQISPYYTAIRTANSVIFLGEDRHHFLEGAHYLSIFDRYSSKVNQPPSWTNLEAGDEFVSAAVELVEKGVLRVPDSLEESRASFWDSLNIRPATAEVAIKDYDAQCATLLEYALKTNGLAAKPGADFLVVVTDDYLRPEIVELSGRAQPWIIAKPVGHTIWLGPLLIPGRTVCWNCMAACLRRNRWLQAGIRSGSPTDYLRLPSTSALPSTVALAIGMLSTALAVYFALGRHPDLEDNILALDTRSMRLTQNLVRHWKDCPQCGSVRSRGNQSPQLHQFVSPITGIVSQLDVTDAPSGALFHACSQYIHPLSGGTEQIPLRPLQALGKGFSSYDAQSGCIAEAVERFSITYQGTEELYWAKGSSVDGITANDLLLFSDLQYESRNLWNEGHSQVQWIPERLSSDDEIAWITAKPLSCSGAKFVPAGLSYMHYPFKRELRFCSPDTNGCAAGRSLSEALLTALLELVERDAVAIWWYNELSRPKLELESFGDPRFLEVKSALAKEGCDVYLLDVTTDIGIPCFVAIAPAYDGSKPYFGCASHICARTAGLKALAEVAQVWFWAQRGAASDELTEWINTANIHQKIYLQGDGTIKAGSECALVTEDALQLCIHRIRSVGIDTYFVDLTRAEIGVPVVRAFAPGLRHFWARFAPGRLYDVPVRMGWSKKAKTELELNPIACMI